MGSDRGYEQLIADAVTCSTHDLTWSPDIDANSEFSLNSERKMIAGTTCQSTKHRVLLVNSIYTMLGV